jgi:hypothetical protein
VVAIAHVDERRHARVEPQRSDDRRDDVVAMDEVRRLGSVAGERRLAVCSRR